MKAKRDAEIKEEEDRRREAAIERKVREYEKKHRDEQGRHVIEHKNQGYLKEITAGGMEILDPTGRALRVDPSQITDIPDQSFGLGKSSKIPAENTAASLANKGLDVSSSLSKFISIRVNNNNTIIAPAYTIICTIAKNCALKSK